MLAVLKARVSTLRHIDVFICFLATMMLQSTEMKIDDDR